MTCDCDCHPKYEMCKQCRGNHDIDALLADAAQITFESDEVKREFISDFCPEGSKGE